MRWLGLICLITLWGCGKPAPDNAAYQAFNNGAGEMGQFQYAKAVAQYASLVTRYPDWTEARVNLGLATLNLQTPGSEDQAIALFDQALAQDPSNAKALYGQGLLWLYKGNPNASLAALNQLVKRLPEDPFLHYYIGQNHATLGNHPLALQHYQEAIKLDPYLRSAYYGAFQAHQRLGQRAEAQEQLTTFQRLANHPQSHQAEFKYTRMGPLALVEPLRNPNPPQPPPPPEGPLFLPALPLDLPSGTSYAPQKQPCLTTVDLNRDGHADLFAPQTWVRDGLLRNAVYLGSPEGLKPAPNHPLVQIPGVRSALWGDLNHDTHTDLVLCRDQSLMVLQTRADGGFDDVTAQTRITATNTRDGSLIDADHDGDLDLILIQADAPPALWNNNLNGTWREITAEAGLHSRSGARRVICADLDHDRDMDLVFLYPEPPHAVFENQLLWSYVPAKGWDAFCQTPSAEAIAADIYVDGQVELLSRSPQGQLQRWERVNDQWQAQHLGEGWTHPNLAWLDVTGSGTGALLGRGESQWLRLAPDSGRASSLPGDGGNHAWLALIQDPQKGPSLVSQDEQGRLYLHPPGPGRFPFMSLSCSGATSTSHPTNETTRSNPSGIGTQFVVRTGAQWFAHAGLRPDSGVGQSLGPVAIGLGGAPYCDTVALTWSDGVFQTELQLAAGKHHTVVETQRQLASCPVLFAWDGQNYRFVSDVLGVGGLGFNLGKGTYAPPRPWEHFQLPPGLLALNAGSAQLKLSEPMEESTYLDGAQLALYDLPPGWSLALDERMATGAPDPTGHPILYREERLPREVRDAQGHEVTKAAHSADLQAVPTPLPDPRFLGLLQHEHQVTLTFDQPLQGPGPAWLLIDGWLEYPYSQTCFAAWQAGLSYEPLSLDVLAQTGQWLTLMPQFGYPAGMPRRMAVPLPESIKNHQVLRLRTNQEIYLDRISVVFSEPSPAALKVHFVTLGSAQLREDGFAQRTTGPQRQPNYEDRNRLPMDDTRHQAGFYTAFGEVGPLVAEVDEAVAIFGPGEALYLQFPNVPPEPPSGKRVYVLQLQGWCKDMDLYTQHGETLTPLPSRGAPGPQRAALHERYQTRYRAGY